MERKHVPFSISKLSVYVECPQKYFFKYIQHLPEIQADGGFKGSTIHEAIAEALRGGNWEDLLTPLNMEDMEEAKIKVLEAIKFAKDLGSIQGIETKFAITSTGSITQFDSENAWFRGIIDMLTVRNGAYEVWDWKTGYAKPTAFQVFSYAWAVEKALNTKVHKAGYILLNSGTTLEYDITDENIEWAEKKIKLLIDKIESDQAFTPHVGDHCAYCPYTSFCPLVKQIESQDIPAIRSKEEAKEVAKEIRVLEEKLDHHKKILNGFVEENGLVDLDDLIYTLELSKFATLPRGTDKKAVAQKAWEIIQEKGLDPFDYFTIETKSLSELGIEGMKESTRKTFKFVKKEV